MLTSHEISLNRLLWSSARCNLMALAAVGVALSHADSDLWYPLTLECPTDDSRSYMELASKSRVSLFVDFFIISLFFTISITIKY